MLASCKKERMQNKEAHESVQVEWDKLRAIDGGAWDESAPRELRQLLNEHQRNGTNCNWGYVFDICVEKNSELPAGHKLRKFKGRVVFAGNRVKYQNWEVAMFQDLGSCPPAMEAGRACIANGLFPGHIVEAADATQAYVQAPFVGTETWVILPPEQVPDKWKHMGRPAFQLKRALYGHPDSGGFWERHCESQIFQSGFERVPEWNSCYWHPMHKTFLVVYVDDFLLSGPKDGVHELSLIHI